MIKISFTNVNVSDRGYGLSVGDKKLEDIISEVLGTMDKNGNSTDVKFSANACDVTVIIDPKKSSCEIECNKGVFNSMEELEEVVNGITEKNDKEADTAE